ncbi:hypothetical protein LQW54_005792 [Pestalotiopsis sp. IQ-011]
MPGLLVVDEPGGGCRLHSQDSAPPTPTNSSAGRDSPPTHRVETPDPTAIEEELHDRLQAAEARLLETMISVIQNRLGAARAGGQRAQGWDSFGESAEDVERQLTVVRAMLAERKSRR